METIPGQPSRAPPRQCVGSWGPWRPTAARPGATAGRRASWRERSAARGTVPGPPPPRSLSKLAASASDPAAPAPSGRASAMTQGRAGDGGPADVWRARGPVEARPYRRRCPARTPVTPDSAPPAGGPGLRRLPSPHAPDPRSVLRRVRRIRPTPRNRGSSPRVPRIPAVPHKASESESAGRRPRRGPVGLGSRRRTERSVRP
jgi:hypothetical protein